jgi:four helix bundle protein
MTVKNLEDLIVWKKSLILCKRTYQIADKLPAQERFNTGKHLRECARNIPGNIAEGFGRYHYQESMQFYRIARGSINEMKSDLYLIKELNYINGKEINEVLDLTGEIIKMLNSLMLTSKNFKSSSRTQ